MPRSVNNISHDYSNKHTLYSQLNMLINKMYRLFCE